MSWPHRLLNLMRSEKLGRELAEEMEFHLESRRLDNLAAGMTPEEARRDAVRRFGNRTLIQERTREARITGWLETVLQDLRYALRGFRRSPGFAVTAILSLALGIGASVSIYTVADHLLLRPLPYPDPERLVMVWETRLSGENPHNVISPGNYLDWKSRNSVFETMAAFHERRVILQKGDRTDELALLAVSAELLPMLGAEPFRGRLFTAEEDRPSQPTGGVVLISHRLWQSWFGGEDRAVGSTVFVGGLPRTVIGVLPPGFSFRDRETDLWTPLGLDPAQDYRATQGRYLMGLARLEPGVPLARAQGEMAGIARQLETAFPEFDKGWTVNLEPLADSLVREVKTALWVLLGAVGLLLAVACANVANLLLARGAARQQEIAFRVALGAGRGRVVRQLLTESLLLGLAGGLLGVLLAHQAVRGLLALAPAGMTRAATPEMDLRILFVAVAVSLLTGILFGIGPALVAARVGAASGIRAGARATAGGGRLRAGLVAGEVALSLILLTGGGLLFRSVLHLQEVDPGLDPSGVLTFRISLPTATYAEEVQRRQFFTRTVERLEVLPGVRSASAVSYLPFNGLAAGTTVRIAGDPEPLPGEEKSAVIRVVMPGYFKTFGIPVTRGRDFTAADNLETTPYRFVVNEAFVKEHLRGRDPLAASLSAEMDDENPFGQIIGVVGDVKEGALDQPPEPTAYYIYSHLPYRTMNLVVRTSGDPAALAGPVRRIVAEVDPAQPVADLRPMSEIVGQTFARQRFSAVLLAGFSLAALLLAAVGVYGVLAYAVSERSRELGVRLALGAQPGGIVRLVVGNGARLVLAGIALGTAGALALTGLLESLLYGLGPRDPGTFAVVLAVLLTVGLLAAWLPARRAARLDPLRVLRAE